MAEYIEREALLNALKEERKNGNFVFTSKWIKEIMDNLPTADVVPKSEVKCIYAYDGEVEEYCVQSPCPNYKTIEQAKQEVARKIFEEIEKDGKYAISFVENHKSYSEDVRQAKLECYKDIQTYIAELKKKYTEGEHNG